MIVVNSPLRQNEIIEVVEQIEIDGAKPFKLIKKQGLKVCFDSTLESADEAFAIIKKEIRKTDFGNVIYFSITEEK